jgi:pectinesterase
MRSLFTFTLVLFLAGNGLAQQMPSLPKGTKWPKNFRELRGIYKKQGIEIKRAAVKPASSTSRKLDLVYAKRGDRKLKLDLFLPKTSTKPAPILVFIHGGGWRTGEHAKAIWFANRGWITAAIENRLAGEARFPAAIHDCKDAIRWTRTNARKYNGDPHRIAVCGGSAGAHLAALVATAGPKAGLEGIHGDKDSSVVQAAIVIAGPTDTAGERAAEQSRSEDSNYRLFLGGTIDEVPATYTRASPAHWVSGETPPMLIIGENSIKSAGLILKNLKANRIPNETFVLTGGIHGEWNWTPWFAITMNRAELFLRQHLN